MAGPDPAIHVFVSQQRKEDVDARHKAGHDDWASAVPHPSTLRNSSAFSRDGKRPSSR